MIEAKSVPLTVSCPGSGHRGVSNIGMQPTAKRTDQRGYKNMIHWDTLEEISLPDAVAIKNPTGEFLLISEPNELRKLPSKSAMFQSDVERHSLTDDLILPQSPLVSPTPLEIEDPPSPSTTLVDDESISSDITSVDPCLLTNTPFASALTAEMDFLGTEAKFYTSQLILHTQAHSERFLRGKRHHTISNGKLPFTDLTEYYYDTFATKLQALNSKNSEKTLCIERYLAQSEAKWYGYVRESRMVNSRASSPSSWARTQGTNHQSTADVEQINQLDPEPGHHRMTALRSVLLFPIVGDWPVYSLLVALVRMKPHSRRVFS